MIDMKGSYLLLIKLDEEAFIPIGGIGKQYFAKGYYVYVGSALYGIEQRVKRHRKGQKKTHWHIDYLLKHAEIIDSYYKESDTREECYIAHQFQKNLLSLPSFGCTDCQCRSHLFYGPLKDILSIAQRLEMSPLR
jgi:Uri superfamily endonuclease